MHIHDAVAREFAKVVDAAVARYKAGEEEVSIEFGGFAMSLYNRKDNADREVVRMSLDEMRDVLVAAVMVGALTAGEQVACHVIDLFGLGPKSEEPEKGAQQ